MIDLGEIEISDEQIELLNVAESFVRDQSSIASVRALIDDEAGFDKLVWQQMGELGWLSIAIPEEYGGAGLSLGEVVPVAEMLGRGLVASPFRTTTLAAQAILSGAKKAQKSEILPQIAAGQAATMALSEADSGWDLGRIKSKAQSFRSGYRLSGTKVLVKHLQAANWIVASVLLDDQPRLVLLNKSDIKHSRREIIIDETQRCHEISLDGIIINQDQLMDVKNTSDCLQYIHLAANLLIASNMTGACKSVIDYTVEYLKTRRQFGKLIGSFQALKHPMVDAFVDYEKARSLLYAAAHSFNKQRVGEISTRMAKVSACSALSFAADRAIQFHGGFGFSYECDAQLYRRKAIFEISQYGDEVYHKTKLADLFFKNADPVL